MRFSIILPIYNVEKYLRPCVESILSQSFSDYEIILVDDGSKDSSPQICDEYSDKYDFIKTVHKINGGQSDARNVGLKHAHGDYVFFIDSDDYLIDNNVLLKINNALDANQDVVAFKFIKWYEKSNTLSTCSFTYNIDYHGNSATKIYLDLIDKDAYYNSPWSKVIKRSILIDNNIEFEKGLLGEDNDWYYKVVAHVKTLALIDEALYVYRQREGSTTKTYKDKNLEHLLWIIEKWTKYIENGKLTENKMVIRNSLAKQYCHAILGYSSLKKSEAFYEKLKKYNYLLQYSNTPRVKKFRLMHKFLGLKGTIEFLRLLKKIK